MKNLTHKNYLKILQLLSNLYQLTIISKNSKMCSGSMQPSLYMSFPCEYKIDHKAYFIFHFLFI